MEIVDIDVAKEELKKFNDISLEPVKHIYSDSLGTKYTSVTTFISKFGEKFDKTGKAFEYSIRHGVNMADVLKDWEYKGDYARKLGTEVHSVMEHLWKREEFEPNWKMMESFEGMKDDFLFRQNMCIELYDKMKDIYDPIANEVIVNDPQTGLAGTIDFVAYNRKTDTVDILDWKTSKAFAVRNGAVKMKAPFDAYPGTNVSEYSLQLSIYKYIVEKYTNLKIGELRLFQLPGKGKPKTIKCYDLTEIIKNSLFSDKNL